MEIFALLLMLGCSQAQNVKLNYALFTASEVFDSSGALPAIMLAEDMINKCNSTLSGYILEHTEVKDTEANVILIYDAMSTQFDATLMQE